MATRIEAAKARYPGLAAQIDQLALEDPSGNQKYLMWQAKQIAAGEPPNEIVSLTKTFDERVQLLAKKDINQYRSLGELRGAIESLPDQSVTQQRKLAADESYKVYEDANVLVIRPFTTAAAQRYGAGTRWCIAAAKSGNMFSEYSEKNIAFYFVIDKKLTPSDPNYKIALSVKDGAVDVATDAQDDEIPLSSVRIWPTIKDAVLGYQQSNPITLYYKARTTADQAKLDVLSKSNDASLRAIVAKNILGAMTLTSLSVDVSELVRAAVAQNTYTPPSVLAVLAVDPVGNVRAAVVTNPSTPPSSLVALAADSSLGDSVRSRIAKNPSTPPSALEYLAKDLSISAYLRLIVAKNPSTPPSALEYLAKDSSDYVRLAVAENPSTPTATLTYLARDAVGAVRAAVAGNTATPPAALAYLARESVSRSIVAENPATPVALLLTLATNSDFYTRAAVARNPSTPPSLLAALAADSNEYVRKLAAAKLAIPASALSAPPAGTSPWWLLGGAAAVGAVVYAVVRSQSNRRRRR